MNMTENSQQTNPESPHAENPEPIQPIRVQPFSMWGTIQTVLAVAIVAATLFTLWTPANLFSTQILDTMVNVLNIGGTSTPVYPTLTPPPRPRIGIVSGHLGHDSGAVCKDGLTEQEVNLKIAELVIANLRKEGFEVDRLNEFDEKLNGYQAQAIVSIHNDTCEYLGPDFTGFKVAAAQDTVYKEKANRLLACLVDRYSKDTGLKFNANTVTNDMTNYHAFGEINTDTPAAIIETGFLNLDREILTQHTDVVAQGVTDGILCYIRNLPVDVQIPGNP